MSQLQFNSSEQSVQSHLVLHLLLIGVVHSSSSHMKPDAHPIHYQTSSMHTARVSIQYSSYKQQLVQEQLPTLTELTSDYIASYEIIIICSDS